MRWLLLLCLTASLARAEGERPGAFDYYVLSLSWSPSWCATEGDARGSAQCDAGRGLGWVLHGLWPQDAQGYPSWCPTDASPPPRVQTAAMADIMGTSANAWHQWRKHGTCSGLAADDFYALSRAAYSAVNRPETLRRLTDPVSLPAGLIEEAFIEANPGLQADMITVTCRDARIQEVRLCLSKSLSPMPCGQDVSRDCTLQDALLDPIR